MLRVAWIFARVRWRMLYNGLAKSKKRDGLERVSRITTVAVPALLFLFMLGLAVLLAVGAWFLAAGIVATPLRAPVLLLPLRLLLISLLLLIALLPSSASKQGALATSTRVHLLPIPRGVLHKVEVLSGLGDPWLAFVVPALIVFCASFALHGRADLALFAAALGAAFVALLAVLSTLASLLASWMFRSRRRTEALTLIFVLVFSLAGLVPLLIGEGIEDDLRDPARRGKPGDFTHELQEFDAGLPWFARALPTELFASTLRHALGGRSDAAWACVALLCAEVLALYLVSSLAHARLSQPTGGEASRRREHSAVRAWWRVPGFSPASSAIAHAQVRSVLRSVRGRVIVLMPGPLVATLGLMTRAVPEALPLGGMFAARGHMLLGAGLVFSQYALLAVTMNQFASDRAGLTLQFLAPVSERELVRGKALACVIIGSIAAAICALGCALTMSVASPLSWISVLLGGLATALLLQPFGVLFSATLPVAADLSKTGSGGNPHSLAFLLGTLLVMALSAPVALILNYVDHLLQRPALALLLVAAWTACAAVIAWVALGFASGALAARRENVGLVAQGR